MNVNQDQTLSDQNSFWSRAASVNWEQIALDPTGQTVVWAWFKPANAPTGLFLQIPEQTFQQLANTPQLSMRYLLTAVGINPTTVASWVLQGASYDSGQGSSPLLDQPIPVPAPGTDPNIVVYLIPPNSQPPLNQATFSQPVPQPVPANQETIPQGLDIFIHIETDWNKSQEIEKQLNGQRRKMVMMMNKLNGLTRDLTLEESLAATSQDKVEWKNTCTWLRETARNLSKLIKAYDIGITSSAGQRLKFMQLYETYIAPRIQFEGIVQAQREFESYRKMMQTLSQRVQNAQADAANDGERRAKTVLNKIAGRVQKSRTQTRVKNQRKK